MRKGEHLFHGFHQFGIVAWSKRDAECFASVIRDPPCHGVLAQMPTPEAWDGALRVGFYFQQSKFLSRENELLLLRIFVEMECCG